MTNTPQDPVREFIGVDYLIGFEDILTKSVVEVGGKRSLDLTKLLGPFNSSPVESLGRGDYLIAPISGPESTEDSPKLCGLDEAVFYFGVAQVEDVKGEMKFTATRCSVRYDPGLKRVKLVTPREIFMNAKQMLTKDDVNITDIYQLPMYFE